MTYILLRVTGAHAWATVTGPLTSGMVGIPITIEYDAAWDGLTKNLVCRCSEWGADSAEQRTILNVGETAVVAHEVMKAGMYLYLGIEGRSADGTLVIPTTWARCGEIQCGANAGTEVSTDPTLPVWEQLQTQLGQLQQDVVTKEQMVGIMDSVQSATQAAAISAGRAEAAAKREEEAAADQDSRIAPHIGANGNWFVGDTDTGVKAAGEDGYTPVKGVDYFTEDEAQEIAELAAGMVDVPGGTEVIRANELLASGSVAAGSSGFVETGMTWGQLKEYSEFVLMIASVGGNTNFPNNSDGFRIRTATNGEYWGLPPLGTLDKNYSGAVVRVRFIDDEKTIYNISAEYNTAYQVKSSVAYSDASMLNYRSTGFYGSIYGGMGYVDLTAHSAGAPDDSPVVLYFNTATTCEYEWKAIGVFR